MSELGRIRSPHSATSTLESLVTSNITHRFGRPLQDTHRSTHILKKKLLLAGRDIAPKQQQLIEFDFIKISIMASTPSSHLYTIALKLPPVLYFQTPRETAGDIVTFESLNQYLPAERVEVHNNKNLLIYAKVVNTPRLQYITN